MSTSTSSSSQSIPQWKVEVWLYDLTQGMARQLSMPFLGKQIDGIWHTGVVVYGWEYFYGGGIQTSPPGMTLAGQPMRKIDMGYTATTQQQFHTYLHSVSDRFTPATYSLLSHNCNNFTHEAVKFLTGLDIPAYITGLPEEALNSPMGIALRPMIMNMEQQFRNSQGGGMIPWTADLLNLPPCRATPDRYHSPTQQAAQQQQQVNRLERIQQQPQHVPITAATSILSATSSTHPHHPHAGLGLTIISASSKPMLSNDKKTTAFWTLMKVNAKKVNGAAALTEEERNTLEKVVEAMGGNDIDIPNDLEIKSQTIFERLIFVWPVEQIFPVLGLFRLFVLRPRVAAYYQEQVTDSNGNNEKDIIKQLLSFSSSSTSAPMAAQSMSLCIIANLFSRPAFGAILSTNTSLIDTCRTALTTSTHPSVRVMAATVLYNMSLILAKDDSDITIELTSTLTEHSLSESDAETLYRTLLCLGHLIYGNSSAALLVSSLEWNTDGTIEKKYAGNKNINNIVKDIQKILAYEQQQMANGD